MDALHIETQATEDRQGDTLPTCTHNGLNAPCWYCSLPDFMFDQDGRMKPEYRRWATPWNAPRFWLGEGERKERLAR